MEMIRIPEAELHKASAPRMVERAGNRSRSDRSDIVPASCCRSNILQRRFRMRKSKLNLKPRLIVRHPDHGAVQAHNRCDQA
jgi:hypothetical protein